MKYDTNNLAAPEDPKVRYYSPIAGERFLTWRLIEVKYVEV